MPIKFSSRAKRRAKSFLSMVLAVVMLMGLLPMMQMPASAADLSISNGARVTLAGGTNYTLATSGTFTNVTYRVNSGAVKVVIPSGVTVTIDNRTAGGESPFIIAGGTLELVVNGVLNVYGQHGQKGHDAVGEVRVDTGRYVASGGWAGIYVQPGTNLILRGSGTLKAYGGDAGDGLIPLALM